MCACSRASDTGGMSHGLLSLCYMVLLSTNMNKNSKEKLGSPTAELLGSQNPHECV